jgi:predicted acylesterase/phospholipase RssA/MinD-like ATPase involved in chromosome partitioning or flagellar assembly
MIYTFYSYKGGVGRSMALANIAESLHAKGLCVIMIDWDLEAPGLEIFFSAPDDVRQLAEFRAHPGLIEMIVAYKNAYPKFTAQRLQASGASASSTRTGDAQNEAADKDQQARAVALTKKMLEEAHFPDFIVRDVGVTKEDVPQTFEAFLDGLYRTAPPSVSSPGVGGKLASSPFGSHLQCIHPPDQEHNGVYLLSAGARSEDKFSNYAVTVQNFDWSEFYAAYEGREYFTWFRNQLREIADVVLVDSRTGVTEMGGVCTRHIADAVVSFCAPNFQNVDGVLRVVSGLNKSKVKQARDDRSVQVLVIPTRIDNSESDRLHDFSESFAQKVERSGLLPPVLADSDRPLWNLQIPYIPRYNYREERVIGPDTRSPDPATQKLIDSYRRIAVHLAVLAPEGHRIREVFAGEIQSTFPFFSKVAPQLAPAVSDTWIDRPLEYQTFKDALLRSSERIRVAVCGSAGTGKTALVARVCRDPEVVSSYPDGIFWLNVQRKWTGEEAQEWLRTKLGLERQGGERALREALSSRRFLLVADDVWRLDDLAELLTLVPLCAQVIITRDAAVASEFDGRIVNVGALTPEQSLQIIKADLELTAPQSDRFDVAQRFTTLPLGARLVRSALDRLLLQGMTAAQAQEQLRNAFQRHDILAFDQLEGADRSTSIARSLKESISRLTADEESLLIRLAKANDAQTAERVRSSSREMQRLAELGLIDQGSGKPVVHPLIRAYLLVEGRLDRRFEGNRSTSRISSSADKRHGHNPDVELAKRIIHGETVRLDDIHALAERLKEERYFTYARKLFARALEMPEAKPRALKLLQRQALSTYRDPDLPAESRFAEALALLKTADLDEEEPSSETLGLAGAIHKYKWKLTGLRSDLEQSVFYYGRGARRDVTGDQGYTGINAAFMLDLLAEQERKSTPADALRHSEQARSIRERIVFQLPPFAERPSNAWLRAQWWFFATLAEASFGLSRFSEARFWLREGLALNPPDWELESTTRQLAALAIAKQMSLSEDSEAYRTLRILFGDATYALRGATIGKVGLALSGGGFRASLFHIGVLARLAELDMLRYVEVLSCVSGGSILGAHYYLEVRRLLQEKADSQVTRDDYIEIVRRLEQNFLAAVKKNLRLRLFAAWWTNFRTLFQAAYTRTVHLGWLFEKHIYSRVRDGHSLGPWWRRRSRVRRWLNELQIKPRGDRPDFNPKVDNWARAAKAPILLLNATTLNTGHNWQFAVSWMGEPELGANSTVDRNDILRRMYYWEAPERHRGITLGQAVAASACVPSLFDPVELQGLYPDRSVRLVDGGTHDNQGIAGLLEQECTVMVVSDASGQSSSEKKPSEEILPVAFRTNNILMARVREAQYRELDLLRRSSALKGLAFLHLKKDLDAARIDWVDCQDPTVDKSARTATTYGIPRPVQSRIARIRTDLDSFSDTEAYTLMLSGYRMMSREAVESLSHLPLQQENPEEDWTFRRAVEVVALRVQGKEVEHVDLLKQLGIGANQLFKVWRFWPILGYVGVAALVAAGLGGLYLLRDLLSAVCPFKECGAVLPKLVQELAYDSSLTKVSWFAVGLAALLGAAAMLLVFGAIVILIWLVHWVLRTEKSISVIATGLAIVTVGWLLALLHLYPLNWVYLRRGRVKVPRAA